MYSFIIKAGIVTLAILLCSTGVSSRSNVELTPPVKGPEEVSVMQLVTDTPITPNGIIDWPTFYGVQQTGVVNATFDCFGMFGKDSPLWFHDVPGWPYASFETPSGGNIEYLFNGGLWIGGIVGQDTLVSTGIDGWSFSGIEYRPPDYPNRGSVQSLNYASDYTMTAAFNDTTIWGVEPDWSGRPHLPLNIEVSNRSHIWRTSEYEDIIVYDAVITNRSDVLIQQMYIGLYFDGDIGFTPYASYWVDDLAGSIKDEGIAYMIDNNGDPILSSFDPYTSPLKILAVKLLESSHRMADLSFNWWESNYMEELDFGPRKKGTPRDPFFDFGTGGLGTPEGDVNKYYMLSHDEWDYDQIYTASIGSSDPRWLEPPPELAPDLSDGYDTKVLLSFGPVDLQPDSSVRFLYAMFTADDVHVLPTNGDNLPLNPEAYLANLNFDEVLLNAERAEDLVEILTDPMLPVLGLRLIAQGQDTASIRWDPWVFDNINGYEIFLSDIPVDDIPYPGVVPPWLMTPDPDPHTSLGTETDYTFTSLKQDYVYYTKVAHRMPSEVGQTSDPLLIDFRNFSPPTAESEAVYYSPDCSPDGSVKCDNLPRIEWSPPDQVSVDRYNIYRFADSASLLERYYPFYDHGECLGILDPKEIFYIDDDTIYFYAMDVYAEVDNDIHEFVDENPIDGAYYIVTSVDRNGLESHFSEPVIAYEISNFQQDILVLTNLAAFWSKTDSIRVFYEDILAGYDFDIYSVHDTAAKYGCWVRLHECIQWQDFTDYKLLILDEDSWNPFFSESFEDESGALTNYLCSGGKLAYFGGFEGFNNYDRYLAQTYTAQYDFIQRFFGIDNIFYYGLGFYGLPFPCAPNLDTCFGFVEAESVLPSWPDIYYDQSRDPFFMVNCYWLLDSPPCVATFDVNDAGRVSHVYRSIYPEISWVEGDRVGVKTTTTEAETYLFGFHLWYMQRESGEQLIDGIFKGIVPGGKEKVLAQVPDKFGLNQNYPNPFNPTTVLSFNLPKPARVTLEIFNILGQRVNTLIPGEQRQAGLHQVEWHGDNAAGDKVGSGIYFYRLRADDEVATRKMMLLK